MAADMTATWHIDDSLTVLRTLPTASVDLVLTSPPFLALRSYLPADDPMKPLEMGSEPTPGEYLDALLDVIVECRRVLAPHGSLCVELGDTYAGSGGAGGDYGVNGLREGQEKFDGSASRWRSTSANWPLDKSLCLIPESFRFALAYGRNPHTGRTIEPWRIRNVVRWCRPNPPVGALADKFRPATSEMVVACTSRSRYFDLDAVRTEPAEHTLKYPRNAEHYSNEGYQVDTRKDGGRIGSNGGNPAGAPPLDWWWIPTQPYRGAHYATWPEDLCIIPIEAMCPRRVCTVCGEPSRRVVEPSDDYRQTVDGKLGKAFLDHSQDDHQGRGSKKDGGITARFDTLGWTDCGHNTWRTGVVLDPFAGSGTTLAVAVGHGRHAIGIDLDERNYHLARERIGMFLTLADDTPTVVAVATRGAL